MTTTAVTPPGGTAQWHPMVTRREYQIAANLTGLGVDDPDANFYENHTRGGSPRVGLGVPR